MLASPSSAHRTPQVNVLCFTAAMGKQYGFPPREVKAGFWKLATHFLSLYFLSVEESDKKLGDKK